MTALIVAIVLVTVAQVTGVCVMAYFQYRMHKEVQKTIVSMAMFKKAREPWQINAMAEAHKFMEQDHDEEEERVADPVIDEPTIPNNPSDEAMAHLRTQI